VIEAIADKLHAIGMEDVDSRPTARIPIVLFKVTILHTQRTQCYVRQLLRLPASAMLLRVHCFSEVVVSVSSSYAVHARLSAHCDCWCTVVSIVGIQLNSVHSLYLLLYIVASFAHSSLFSLL
jgi:hypothetical protein